ncbi:MAG: GGDEF domain-containing protein, partial [Synergistaceae bacterium]|nr:GGDEF domain-containing protein [Synergistaceae bacterium]
MKRRLFLIILFSLIMLSLAGCRAVSNEKQPLEIKTYKDVPGVTDEEIAGIEALKSNRGEFSYGSLYGTEAFFQPDGSTAGFSSEFCSFLSDFFGMDFVLEIYEWDELTRNIVDKSLDFTGELTSTEERNQVYTMSAPIAERFLRIFTNKFSDNVIIGANVNRLKIGFLEDSITEASILKVYPASYTRIDVENYQMAADLLESGEIDAFIAEAVADSVFADYDFINSAIFFPMVYESVSLATANAELAPIISVINKYIDAGGFDNLYELYNKGDFEYTKNKLMKTLSDVEIAFLQDLTRRGASIAVAYEHDNYPVSFFNKTEKEFQGIAIDVLAEIGKLTGIDFKLANSENDPWAVLYDMLINDEVSIVSQLIQTADRKDNFLWPDAPYTSSRYVFMSKQDYPDMAINQALRARVGVVSGTAYEEKFIEWFGDSENLIRYSTQDETLIALEADEIDLLMGTEYQLLAQQNYREKPGYKVNIRLDAPTDSYFGINKDEAVLCSIISKAQAFAKTEAIASTWESRGFDYAKKLTEQRSFYLMAFVVVLIFILALTVFFLRHNIKLGKKLKELANTDALTGVYNRRCFMDLCVPQIERVFRSGGECFIMIFDLDHFKSVNDTYGHQAGDQVLKEVSGRMKSAIRPYDTLARYGGEEFI